jgi:HlyD family secretion protein
MPGKWIKRILGVAVLALVVAAGIYALRPAPIAVDTSVIASGPLEVTVDEEGVARIRDVYRVSAPLAGSLNRLPVHIGDIVQKGVTQVAAIEPAPPPLIDVRSRRELEAAVGAAEAAVGLAEAQVRSAEASLRLAMSDYDRINRLAGAGTVSERTFEEATTAVDTAKAAVEQARANLTLRQSELASAQARLMGPTGADPEPKPESCCVPVLSPVNGVVLKLIAESEQVVTAGAPLVEIGDPTNLEIVVHLLSSDAVGVSAGAPATLTDWGGAGVLRARVRKVDPAAYTKVSALGIEEQRVDVTLDILDSFEKWNGLGHEYRVMVHIGTWQGADVVQVPIGALFRRGSDWSVFRVVDGRAVETKVAIGHRTNLAAEVLNGLRAGETVVLHPSDKVAEGVAIETRPNGA